MSFWNMSWNVFPAFSMVRVSATAFTLPLIVLAASVIDTPSPRCLTIALSLCLNCWTDTDSSITLLNVRNLNSDSVVSTVLFIILTNALLNKVPS